MTSPKILPDPRGVIFCIFVVVPVAYNTYYDFFAT